MSCASQAVPATPVSLLPLSRGPQLTPSSRDLTSHWLAAILRGRHGAGYRLRRHESYALSGGPIAACSQMRGFTARGRLRGHEVTDHVVVKLLPEDPLMRRLVVEHRMFQCETMVYRELLPALCRFEAERGCGDVAALTVPCLYAEVVGEPDCAIVLENMQKRRFTTTKSLELQKPQLNAAVRALAQLAATSHVWLEQTGTESLPYLLEDVIPEGHQVTDFIRFGIDKISGALEAAGQQRLVQKLLLMQLSSARLLTAFLRRRPAFRVLCHGDFRDGNLLLREAPDGDWQLRVVDWQTARLAGPALDLLYLLLFSVPRSVMVDVEAEALAAYRHCFNRKLAQLGCGRRLSAERLRLEFTEAKLVGLVWCLAAVQFWDRVPGWVEHTVDLALEVDELGLLDVEA